MDYNPYPTVNILHNSRLVSGSGKPGHKILCYDPPPGRHRDFELAWRALPDRQRECVEVRFAGGGAKEDGTVPTVRDLAGSIGMEHEAFKKNVYRGINRIEYLIDRGT